MKIFINPGHDPNIDPGACANGLREADVVLKIGKRVEGYLRAVGYDVKLFQYDGLGEICFDANAWKADLFVSIHCNAATGSAKGTETFSSGGAKSTRLATCIQAQLVNSLPVVDRGVKTANYYVLKNTDAPAVLAETAFIDNPDDAKLLLDREDDFARAIRTSSANTLPKANSCVTVVDAARIRLTRVWLNFWNSCARNPASQFI